MPRQVSLISAVEAATAIVSFGVEAASRHWHLAVLRLIPIAAFMLDVVATETLARPRVSAAGFADR